MGQPDGAHFIEALPGSIPSCPPKPTPAKDMQCWLHACTAPMLTTACKVNSPSLDPQSLATRPCVQASHGQLDWAGHCHALRVCGYS